VAKGLKIDVPKNYFPDDDHPDAARDVARPRESLFVNWLNNSSIRKRRTISK
jgi:homoserine trans-succinylase